MKVTIINKKQEKTIEVLDGITIKDLLKSEEIPIETVVIKVNNQTVTEDEVLNDGDIVEVIKVIYGG